MKIVRQISLPSKIFMNLYIYVIIATPFLLSIISLKQNLQRDTLDIFVILAVVFGLVSGGLILYSACKINRLIRITGTFGREDIRITAENLGWQTIYHNKDYSRFKKTVKFFDLRSWDWGRELTVIYDNDSILINCIALGRGDTPSPFHWHITLKEENRFVNELNTVMNSVPTTAK